MRFRAPFLAAFFLTGTGAAAISSDCVLVAPEPMLKNGTLTLDEHRIATERLQLEPDISLVLEQAKCEYVTTIFKFTLEKPVDVEAAGVEYRTAIELLDVLEKKQPALKLKAARDTLRKYLDLVANPQLGEQLYITRNPETQFAEAIAVTADIGGTPVKIEVSISSGPH